MSQGNVLPGNNGMSAAGPARAEGSGEAEYRQLLAEYTLVLQSGLDPMFLVDVAEGPVFRYRWFNRACEQLTGIPSAQVRGKTPRELRGEKTGGQIETMFAACRQKKAPLTYQTEREYGFGRRFLQVTLTPRLENGEVVQIAGTFHDITEFSQVKDELQSSMEKYEALFNNASDPMSLYRMNRNGPPGRFIEVNDACCRFTGYTHSELLALSPADLDDLDYARPLYSEIKRELIENRQATFEMYIRRKDGVTVPVEIKSRAFHFQGEEVVLGVMRDISERKLAERHMAHRLEMEKAVADVSSRLIGAEGADFDAIAAVLGRAVRAGRCCIFFSRDGEEKMEKAGEWTAAGWGEYPEPRPKREDCDLAALLPQDKMMLIGPAGGRGKRPEELRLLRQLKAKSLLSIPICSPTGRNLGLMGFTDIKDGLDRTRDDQSLLQTVAQIIGTYLERKADTERIKYLSYHDKLTGLHNKAFFEEELARLSGEEALPLSMISCDVNGLKLVNDVFGHPAGDELLASAAHVLRHSCRKQDVIARWGGDEFVILLPRTAEAEAFQVAERIRQACGAYRESKISVSIALGVATRTSPQQGVDSVLKEAEDRMYRNKLTEAKSARSAVIASLEKTLWERNYETEEHAKRMQGLALQVGRYLGLPQRQLDELVLLAALHDIGKIAVPEAILAKPGQLTADEYSVIQRHPEIGYRIALATPELAPIAESILAHHERWDGGGYPRNLQGEEIPLVSRIIAIIDAFDAMTNDRPYRGKKETAAALAELRKEAGRQFDPVLTEVFAAMAAGSEEAEDAAG